MVTDTKFWLFYLLCIGIWSFMVSFWILFGIRTVKKTQDLDGRQFFVTFYTRLAIITIVVFFGFKFGSMAFDLAAERLEYIGQIELDGRD